MPYQSQFQMTSEARQALSEYLSGHVEQLRGPEHADKVYKDECVYCFETPFAPSGLFICLHDFVGVCAKHIDCYVEKTSSRIFLNIHKTKIPSEEIDEPKDKMQRLCIKPDKEGQVVSDYSLRIHPFHSVPLPTTEGAEAGIPGLCDEIIAHISAELQQRLDAGISEWDGEERMVAKDAQDLNQINFDGAPIPYSGWICAQPGCGLRENLWLNLSDGVIMCGRYAPMSGVNGNGHAKKHFENTGHPLVVKLGTIENGDGDIYSYSEDAPVRDPWLGKHLAHFGLDITHFQKSEKTTLELELDANLKHEFSTIQEEGATLQNAYGPGYTGLINLGSSCYINSVLQLLRIVPDITGVYNTNLLLQQQPLSISEDFNSQLAKLMCAMSSGDYSREESNGEERGIRPTIFRRVAGRGHNEFSTAKQQDAEEYLRHLFDKIDASLPSTAHGSPVTAFRFHLVNRFVDEQSGFVRYSVRDETILSLPIPMEFCVDSDTNRKRTTLEQCLTKCFADEFIDNYTSPVLKEKGRAVQTVRMGSFPDFLIIQLQRFTHTATYEVKKLDVDVEMAEELDLNAFYSDGQLQPGEQPLPDDNEQSKLNLEFVNQLLIMGFTENAAKKATLYTKNESLDAAVNWLLQHMDDSNLNEPHPQLAPQVDGAPIKAIRHGGPGRYQLRAFISHMGSSPHSGHYVTHLRSREGVWHIFNDEKVAVSQKPPLTLGYLYIYERI